MSEPLGPDKALGFVSNFILNLKEDEALILTLNMMGTKYFSVNSYRPFLVSPEHVYPDQQPEQLPDPTKSGWLHHLRVRTKGPGVHNWIDSSGIPFGYVAIRWQTLTHPVAGTLKNGVQRVQNCQVGRIAKQFATDYEVGHRRGASRTARDPGEAVHAALLWHTCRGRGRTG